ncbi:MAG: DUF6272 family protein [Flavobacteriales bacterium]
MSNSKKNMQQNLLEYKGQLTGELRLQLIDLVKCAALCNLGSRSDLKKLVGVALELLDNAQRYNAGSEVDFAWRIDGEHLVVSISNSASGGDARRLMDAVENIEAMTPEQVAEAFKQQMLNEGFGEKGGAGLGMLQIAKKVGKGIRAEIKPLTDGILGLLDKVCHYHYC